jgi:hypothetical protein
MAAGGRWCMRIIVVLLASVSLLPSRGASQTAKTWNNHLYDRLELGVFGTAQALGTTIRVDPEGGGSGTEFKAGQVLGLGNSTFEPAAYIRWRLGRRHELQLGYQLSRRSGERTLADTLRFRDTLLVAGARVSSTMRTDQAGLIYRFAFTAKDRTQIGIGVGISVLPLRLQLDAVAGVTGGGADTARVEGTRETSFTVPTGSLGLYGRFRVGERWYVTADTRGLYLKIQNFKIYVFEGGLQGRYFFSNAIGAELGYTISAYQVDVQVAPTDRRFLNIDFAGKLRFTAHSFRLGLVVPL